MWNTTYAALEQVADGRLGPWTDLYAYGAVLWRMVAGGNRPWEPPNPVKVESRANARVREVEDPLPTAKELGAGRFADSLLETIDGCLQLRDTERLGDTERVVELLQAGGGGNQVPARAESTADGSTDSVQPESVNEGAQPVRTGMRGLRKVLAIAAVIAAVLALATAALMKPVRWSFRIEPIPATATVSLVDGSAPYQPGMLLVPGRYEVEVSAPGYITRREWITHSESPTSHRIVLEGRTARTAVNLSINGIGSAWQWVPNRDMQPTPKEESYAVLAARRRFERALRWGDGDEIRRARRRLDLMLALQG